MTDLRVPTGLEVDAVTDPVARTIIRTLLALIEQLAAENTALRTENQQLKDEVARLKGEQGTPTIRPQCRPADSTPPDLSSERERRAPTAWHKGTKRNTLQVTRTERLRVDLATLPPDAVCKGYEPVRPQGGTPWCRISRSWWRRSASNRRCGTRPASSGGTGQPCRRGMKGRLDRG